MHKSKNPKRKCCNLHIRKIKKNENFDSRLYAIKEKLIFLGESGERNFDVDEIEINFTEIVSKI